MARICRSHPHPHTQSKKSEIPHIHTQSAGIPPSKRGWVRTIPTRAGLFVTSILDDEGINYSTIKFKYEMS